MPKSKKRHADRSSTEPRRRGRPPGRRTTPRTQPLDDEALDVTITDTAVGPIGGKRRAPVIDTPIRGDGIITPREKTGTRLAVWTAGAIPTAAIRGRLRGAFGDRVAVLERIADGEAVEETVVSLADLVKHVSCPSCGKQLIPDEPDPREQRFITIKARRSARVMERLAAMDTMAKYGVGMTREVSVEEIKQRLIQTIEVLETQLSASDAERVMRALRPIWKS